MYHQNKLSVDLMVFPANQLETLSSVKMKTMQLEALKRNNAQSPRATQEM